jgi:hypothetical protein
MRATILSAVALIVALASFLIRPGQTAAPGTRLRARFTVVDAQGRTLLEVRVTGKVTRKDYEGFVPIMEQRIKEQGKLRILVIKHELQGWDAGALWEDLKFDLRHFNDIERLAIIGGAGWQRGVVAFYQTFITSRIRYFNQNEVDKAREWLQE